MIFDNPTDEIMANRKTLREYEEKIRKDNKIEDVREATSFAISNRTSIYYSQTIENFYCALAERTKTADSCIATVEKLPAKRKFLHVMTRSYVKGGHTRFVERWIEGSDTEELHSVYLTDQHNPKEIPKALKVGTNLRHGVIYNSLMSADITDKANLLRKISLNYDVIVLHHHMNDPIPLMAYCVKEFDKPIVVFNHAGHLFWIGRCITDFVIDIETGQNRISTIKRGIKNSATINLISSDVAATDFDKNTLRDKLKISSTAFVITTMATDAKYFPAPNYHFPKTIEKIMQLIPNAVFIGLGLQRRNPIWKDVIQIGKGRVILTGSIPFQSVAKYLAVSDLYMDSFPVNSWTSLLDAISIGKLPVVTIKTAIGLPLFIENSSAVTHSTDELIKKVVEFSSDTKKLAFNQKELQSLIGDCSKSSFSLNISSIIEQVLALENIKSRDTEINDSIDPLDLHMVSISKMPQSRKYGISGLLEYQIAGNGMRSINFLSRNFPLDI